MGAWGYGPFENDDAADFVYAFEEEGAVAVREALMAAYSTTSYLEAPEASAAIAAAAFVTAALGHLEWLSEPARQAFAADSTGLSTLKEPAGAALDRILMAESELLDLWEEAGTPDFDGFKETLAKLRSSLG